MTTTTTEYHCTICGGRDLGDNWIVRGVPHGRFEHVDAMDCVRVLASKLAQAQEDIRAINYRLNTAARP